MLVTSGLSLFVAGLAFVTIDVLSFRRATVENLSTLARVVAENVTAALAFIDHDAAHETLGGLRGEPQIVSARVLTYDGELFALYKSSGLEKVTLASEAALVPAWLSLRSTADSEGYSFAEGGVEVYREVRHRGDLLGFVVIRGNLVALWTRMYWSATVLGMVLLIAWGVAYLLAGRFRREISEPIIALEQAMLDFSRNRNERAFQNPAIDDEVGRLIQGFNAMVKEIRLRDQRLNTAIDELRVAKEAAEAADQAKLRFIATLSHEVRGPMTGVVAMTDLLLATPLNVTQADSAVIIKRSAENLIDFVRNVLDYAKLESGRMTLEVIEFDLDEVVDGVIKTMAGAAHHRGLTLMPCIEYNVPRRLKGDPVRLRQVLLNLLSNAVKFTSMGSVTVRVNTRTSAATRCEGTCSKELAAAPLLSLQPDRLESQIKNVDVEFHVIDTGMGIASEAQQRLFEPFEQAEPSTTRRFGGSGLGLAIAKEFVELMGGAIEVKSTPGMGSTFSFYTPLEISSAVSKAPTAAPQVLFRQKQWMVPFQKSFGRLAGTAAPRVLLAEDNVLTQEVTSRVLRSFACDVDVVSDGVHAVSAVKANRYDLVILDWYMPVMDGLKTAEAIRDFELQGKLGNRLPIVLTTAASLPAPQLSRAVDDYLVKPYHLDDVALLLLRWCPVDGSTHHAENRTRVIGPETVKANWIASQAAMYSAEGQVLLDPSILDWFESNRPSTHEDAIQNREPVARRDRIINLFISQSQELLTDLERACERHNEEILYRSSHALKNLAANVGGRALFYLCAMLEQEAKAVDWPRVNTVKQQIVTCHKSTCTQLVEYKELGYGRFSEHRGAA